MDFASILSLIRQTAVLVEMYVETAKCAALVPALCPVRQVWTNAAIHVLICRLISQTAEAAGQLVRPVKFAVLEHAPFHAKLVWTNALDFA